MKLDPEERIIAAALDQAALNQANEHGAGARIEFSRDGRARAAGQSGWPHSARGRLRINRRSSRARRLGPGETGSPPALARERKTASHSRGAPRLVYAMAFARDSPLESPVVG
jgi:hypothetical protein